MLLKRWFALDGQGLVLIDVFVAGFCALWSYIRDLGLVLQHCWVPHLASCIVR